VLIADDHEAIRKGVRTILRSRQDVEICGEASNGSEAIRMAVDLNPDLIILDLTMPVMGGFAAAKELRRLLPAIPILFYSMHEGTQLMKEAKQAGARGFVSKDRISDTLLDALDAVVVRNGTFFPDGGGN
jgi:DNA-binding NarL/FixJ family response regulator